MKQSSKVRWREVCSTKKTCEVGDNLLLNAGHTANWEIFTYAPKRVNKHRILNTFYIRTLQPTLNNQLNTKHKLLFRNNITWFLMEDWVLLANRFFKQYFNLYKVFPCHILKSIYPDDVDILQKTSVFIKTNILWLYILCSYLSLIDQWWIILFCKQKQSLLFNVCIIFDLLISRTEKLASWPLAFKPDFYIFSFNEQLRKI